MSREPVGSDAAAAWCLGRRRVFALYDAVRAQDDPEDAHELWRIERDCPEIADALRTTIAERLGASGA